MSDEEGPRKRARKHSPDTVLSQGTAFASTPEDNAASSVPLHNQDTSHDLPRSASAAQAEPLSTTTTTAGPSGSPHQQHHTSSSVANTTPSDQLQAAVDRWAFFTGQFLKGTGRLAQLDDQFALEKLATSLDLYLREDGHIGHADEDMFDAWDVRALLKNAVREPEAADTAQASGSVS